MNEELSKPKKEELLDMLDEMANRLHDLPQYAMLTPITHADFYSLLLILSSILRAKE